MTNGLLLRPNNRLRFDDDEDEDGTMDTLVVVLVLALGLITWHYL